jgi:D-alanine-D-alanine ligase
MGKKLRIAIMFNQPVTGTGEERKVVTETGNLQSVSPRRNGKASKSNGQQQQVVDFSEIGVLEEMEDIKGALNALGYKAQTFNVDSDVFRLFDYLRTERPDLIFNLVECVGNESAQEMNVAGLYELLDVPYTGASALTLGIALNKPRVKEILSAHGIPTPRYQVFRPNDKLDLDPALSYPAIVKPSREDASVGISDDSVVYSPADLRKRIRYIFSEFEQPALVEEYIEGRELNVAIIGNKRPIVFPISEIDFSGLTDDMHRIVSYDAKWMQGTVAFAGTQGVCPASLTSDQESMLKEIALKCYRIIGCRDYARVDIRMRADGRPYVLEVNPNPDISDDAGFARSARAYGLTFPQVVGKIVEYALERCH